MASLHATFDRALSLRLGLIASALPRLSRHDLEVLVEQLIDVLDQRDGDPDLEPDDEDSAVDDQPCDEPWQDLEPEEDALPVYGVDQTRIVRRRGLLQWR